MDNAEKFVKFAVGKALEECPDDLNFFANFYEKGLLDKLQGVVSKDFARVEYSEAIRLLQVMMPAPCPPPCPPSTHPHLRTLPALAPGNSSKHTPLVSTPGLPPGLSWGGVCRHATLCPDVQTADSTDVQTACPAAN